MENLSIFVFFKFQAMKLGLIVAAGGTGKRIGGIIPKQFHTLQGKPILILTIERILASLHFDSVVVTYPREFHNLTSELLEKANFSNVHLVEGGPTRFDSVWNALQTNSIRETNYVFVHDAVRPFVTKELIIRIYDNLLRYNAVAPGVKLKDTIKEINTQDYIVRTIDRTNLVAIQTPQAFRTQLLISAFEKAIAEGKVFTDEAGAVENLGEKVKIVLGSDTNIKITTPEDLLLASFLSTLE